MSSQDEAGSSAGTTGTTAADYDASYYSDAHLGGCGDYGWESEHWRTFFTMIADRIIGLVAPGTVLDVGCAKGLLVQALAARGVDASGFDISDYAIANAHADVKDRLFVASATQPIERQYDLITCIEVLEHMSPQDAQHAIEQLCAATDRILFSSSPADFAESTHINTHLTANWVAWFAERGFYRRVDTDTSFLTPWAVLFEREALTAHAVVHRYEEQYTRLNGELVEKRNALLEAHRQISGLLGERSARGILDDATLLARHADLVARDNVVGLEAQAATLRAELVQVRGRVRGLRERLKERNEEIAALRASRTWRIGRTIVGPAARLKR